MMSEAQGSADEISARKERRRLSLDDDLKAQLAIERFSGDSVSIRDLAQRHGRAEAVVSRAISSAFAEGLVEVRRVQHRRIKRVSRLETLLEERFRCLRKAIVVEFAPSEPDSLQEYLGNALANFLEGAFRDGERLLIGSGRCVFRLCEALSESKPKLRMHGVTIVSVCGDSYPYHLLRKRNVCLDADANVNLLSQGFEQPMSVGMTSRGVFAGTSEGEWKRQYYEKFWTPAPTLAILGVGVLDSQHQLALLTDPEASKDFPPTDISGTLRTRVRRLADMSRDAGAASGPDDRYTVAEVGMCLFRVPNWEHDPEVPESVAGELDALIDAVNLDLFAPSHEQLARVQSIVLVGGGGGKARALRSLLQTASKTAGDEPSDMAGLRAGLPIRTLCTDSMTARRILSGRG
jgi:DNA-binding transcriptional regulator LsrR (DeoR family)